MATIHHYEILMYLGQFPAQITSSPSFAIPTPNEAIVGVVAHLVESLVEIPAVVEARATGGRLNVVETAEGGTANDGRLSGIFVSMQYVVSYKEEY